MEYSKSVEAKQGTERSELVLPKSVQEDTMRYSTPIQAEDDGRNSMLVASVVYLNNTRLILLKLKTLNSVAHKNPATHTHTATETTCWIKPTTTCWCGQRGLRGSSKQWNNYRSNLSFACMCVHVCIHVVCICL